MSTPGIRHEDIEALAPVWSKIETHCVVCARPFATEADVDLHDEMACDQDPCWCKAKCWVEYGGDCYPSDDAQPNEDELGLYHLYRAWRERAESRHEDIEALAADPDADLALRVLASEYADEIADCHRLIRLLAQAWRVEESTVVADRYHQWVAPLSVKLPDDLAGVLSAVVGEP